MPRRVFICLLALIAASCSSGTASGKQRVVASFYPLAWAARQIGGAALAVEDLTPRGGEPHDIQLTVRQRADIANADVIILIGKGFQPEVERAAADTHGRVVDVLPGLELLPSNEKELGADPHVWLDPVNMKRIVEIIGEALDRSDAAHRVAEKLSALDEEYRSGLAGCRLKTLVTTHQAFGYLAHRYGLNQVGLTGLTPEAEPTAAQIQRVRASARRGLIDAVYYEATNEGERAGKSVARDVGVVALPLNTLESDPAPDDYVSKMRDNLARLRQGLHCP